MSKRADINKNEEGRNARFTIILTECVSNTDKFALSYLLIDVYLTGHFA
jgi:hypothetical protein